jgi:ethanolamine utilization protein EutN
MRIAQVIGTVTLNRPHPSLVGGRFVIAVPYSLDALQKNAAPDGEDVIAYDELAAGHGQLVGLSEGVEATMPFRPAKKPLDAYVACQLSAISLQQSAKAES